MSYNLTRIMDAVTIQDKMCIVNIESGFVIGIAIVLFVTVMAFWILMQYENTIYTSLVVSLFFSSLISSLLLFWSCDGEQMIRKEIVILIWILFAISAFIRTMVDEK